MMILFSRTLGPVPLEVIVREEHSSDLGITELPIENGAKITDNAYIEPKKLELQFMDSGGAVTYDALVRFQETRVPFTFVSGLKVYNNMLIRGLHAERDVDFPGILRGGCLLQEIQIVSTSKVSGGSSDKAQGSGRSNDARAQGTVTRGDQPAKTVPPSQNQSILSRVTTSGSSPIRESSPGGVGGV